jgi:hypothetical protein
VGHVDDAHQPEDEREPAGDDEVQPGQREPVEADDDERAHVLGGLVGNPGGHEEEGSAYERPESKRSGRYREQAPAEREVAFGARR